MEFKDGLSFMAQENNNQDAESSAAYQLRQSLGELGYQQLQKVECSLAGDEMVLTGQLDSFYLKQVAQSVAINIPGIQRVRNEIRVV